MGLFCTFVGRIVWRWQSSTNLGSLLVVSALLSKLWLLVVGSLEWGVAEALLWDEDEVVLASSLAAL